MKNLLRIGEIARQRIRIHGFRSFSNATSDLIKVDVNDKSGVALVTFDKPPVNSLNLELLTSLKKTIGRLEDNKCRGMILTSSSNSVFCAGLDINEMYKPDQERLKCFWTALQDCWIDLYGTSFPTASAINGHSPAGGCLLAMSCEYRVMLPKFTIGLNETQLGIVAPQWFVDTMLNTISQRITEIALLQGKMFSTDEALKIGLVDEIANDKSEAIGKCETFISTFARIPPLARTMTKQQLRGKTIQSLENTKQQDLDKFVFFVNQPKVQKGLEMYLESLKKKASN